MRLLTRVLALAAIPVLLGADFEVADRQIAGLPLHEVRSASATTRLAIILTGDGGWASFDIDLATQLSQRGYGVVGLDSRAYLSTPRTPEEAANDVGRVMRHYQAKWHTTSVTLIGYSRGADIAPFVFNRLPDELRASVDQLVLVGFAAAVNFRFHWEDVVRDVQRPDDRPTRPEVKRMGTTPVLCFYGEADAADACRSYQESPTWHNVRHGTGHRPAEATVVVREILAARAATP